MVHAFLFSGIAVLVEPRWLAEQPGYPAERGARVEMRLLEEVAPRGTAESAQRFIIDQPIWRADLFDLADGTPGNLNAAHFHPYFDGFDPCDRVFDDDLRDRPESWLRTELANLAALLRRSGLEVSDDQPTWLAADAAALEAALPTIQEAVRTARDEALRRDA